MAEFVGKDRQQALGRLQVAWETCRNEGSARLLVLLGNPGVGKTRIVREFFAALAATQPAPPFWPPRIVDEVDKPLDGRGAIAPLEGFEWAPGANPAYAWIGVSCRLDQRRRPENALIEAKKMLLALHEPIAEGRGRRERMTFAFLRLGLLALTLAAVVLGFLGIATVLVAVVGSLSLLANLYLEVSTGSLRTLVRERHLKRREGARATIDPEREDRVLSREAKDYVDGFLDELRKHRLPAVVVIDDATEADPDTLDMVESLLGRAQPVLVVATAHPAPYERQRAEGKGFGALVPKWSRREVLELDPIAIGDLASLVLSIAPRTEEIVARAIADHADGNPLILLAHLETPVLRDHLVDGAYEVEDLPRVLEGLTRDYDTVFARYWDRLDEELRRVLALASFHGELVQPKVLSAGCSAAVGKDADGDVDRARDPGRCLLVRFEEFLDRFSDAGLLEQAQRRRGSVFEPAVIDRARRQMVAEIVATREDARSWERLGDTARRVLLSFHVAAINEGVGRADPDSARSAVELAELTDRPHEAARRAALAQMALDWAEGEDDVIDRARTVGAEGHIETGNVAAALRLLEDQLNYRRRVLGDDHPDTFATRGNLAWALMSALRLQEAIPALQALLTDDLRVLGEDDLGTLGTRKHLASALTDAGRLEDAIPALEALLRDDRRFSGAGAAYIDPGSPWQNPFVESFNRRARDELFAREIFHSIMEARVLYDDWRHTYNTYRPHSALNWLPPAQYASQWSGATIQ